MSKRILIVEDPETSAVKAAAGGRTLNLRV